MMMLTVGIAFYGYASDQVCAIDISEKEVTSFPTIDELKTKKAVLNYKIADVGEFNIDCSSGSVILKMSSFAHLNIRLVSADPNDQQKQVAYAILLAAMRSGETSKYYADGPVADLEKLQSGVQFNLNVQNDTYNTGMPRFWIQFLKSENNNWVDIGFVRLGQGCKDRLSDEGVPHAISQNEALKTIAQKGHTMPGVGGLAEPAILIHKDYQGRGIWICLYSVNSATGVTCL